MERLGEYISRERRMREIRLDEISAATRIRRSYLEALERDDFVKLPSRPFVVGFLRAYARYIGIDEDDVVTRYVFQLQLQPVAPSLRQVRSRTRPGWRERVRQAISFAAYTLRPF